MTRTVLIASACSILTAGLTLSLSQPATAGESLSAATHTQPRNAPPQGIGDMGEMLVMGLKSVPGCHGVELAQTQSGRNTIIAWFENREAAMGWIKHPFHQRLMGMAGVDPAQHRAMQHVPADVPIMVMATITPSDGPNGTRPGIEGLPMPVSQISIELYTPLPGGAHINGRLTPMAVKVPHMKDYNRRAENYGLDKNGNPLPLNTNTDG